jgi:anti-sigma B factor antagonist
VTQPIVIAPAGELDLASVDDFRAAVDEGLERAEGDVIVDLSDVAFIDSSGLGVILHAGEQLRRQQRDLAVVAPRGTAAAVLLTLAGLRRRLTIFDSRSAALRPPA